VSALEDHRRANSRIEVEKLFLTQEETYFFPKRNFSCPTDNLTSAPRENLLLPEELTVVNFAHQLNMLFRNVLPVPRVRMTALQPIPDHLFPLHGPRSLGMRSSSSVTEHLLHLLRRQGQVECWRALLFFSI